MKFQAFCTLLTNIEKIIVRDPPLPAQLRKERVVEVIDSWFRANRSAIDASEKTSSALLSAFFPKWRSDRVYSFQTWSLSKTLGRCFLLGTSRQQELERWRHGPGDLGQCVERVLTDTFSGIILHEMTLEEVDDALEILARRSRFSGPNVRGRGPKTDATTVDQLLRNVYLRLCPQEAKIFTRMILKDYGPVELPQSDILKCYHHLMAVVLKVHDNVEEAIKIIRGPHFRHLAAMPSPQQRTLQREVASLRLTPKLGIKVGRPTFLKARSVRHASQLANGRIMSLEHKYDGEYCQIHVNAKSPGCEIQIFSKSGKDSTIDRGGVLDAIKQSLRIGRPDCQIAEKCILEGEILVWSDKDQKTLDFHKVRKHVSRSGVFLGTALDSQAHPWEHLMMVFFDAMLIDNDNLLDQPYTHRRKRLTQLVNPIQGRAIIVEHETIDFSHPEAQTQLLQALATGFAKRWEGFVLKPCNDPYINFQEVTKGDFPSCWIKLKKDYIKGLGDTVDLVIVGAGRDATASRNPKIRWTHFHIGCLMNKLRALNHGDKPKFLVLDAFQWGIPESKMLEIQKRVLTGAFQITDPEARDLFDLDIEPGLSCNVSVIFKDPPVFEMLGSGFDKCPNRGYFQLRFPRLYKVHWDRDFREAVDFDELQVLAEKAMNAPPGDLREEVETFAKKLELGVGHRENWPAPLDNSPFLDDSEDSDVEEVALIVQRPALLRTDTAGVLPSEIIPLPPRTLLRSTTAPMAFPQEDPPQAPKAIESMSSVSKRVIATTHIDSREVRHSTSSRKRQREQEYSQPDSEPTPKRLSPSSNASIRAKLRAETEILPLSEITNSAERPRRRSNAGTCSPPKRQKMADVSTKMYVDQTVSLSVKQMTVPSSSANTMTAFTSTASTIPSSFEQTRRKSNAACSSPPTSPLVGNQPLHQIRGKTTQTSSQIPSRHDAGVTMQGAYLKPPVTPTLKRRNPWYSPAETTTASASESSSHPTVQEPMRVVHSSPLSSPCARPASLYKVKAHNRSSSGILTPLASSPLLPRLAKKMPKSGSPCPSIASRPPNLSPHAVDPTSTRNLPPIFFLGTALPAHLRKPQTEDSQTMPLSSFSPADILSYVSSQKVLILVDMDQPQVTAKDLHGLKPMAQVLGKIGRGIEIWDWGGEPLDGEWWMKSKILGRRRRRIIGVMKASEKGEVRVEWFANMPPSCVELT